MDRQAVRSRTSCGRTMAALLLAGCMSSACYRYAAVSPAAASPTEEVRLRITEAAATRFADELGTFSTEIDGQLSVRGPDTLAVAVPIVREYRGTALESTTQTLLLGRSEVVNVRRREFSRSRTILATAGTLVGFALLARAIVQVANPNPSETEPPTQPPPPESRVPIGSHLGVRIPVP